MKEHKYIIPGEVVEHGEKLQAEVEWSVTDGRFSMTAGLYSKHLRDYVMCGAGAIQEIARLFPNDVKLQRMAAIAKEWHLNDMQAGSPDQRAFLKANPGTVQRALDLGVKNHYDATCAVLKAAGLNPDPNYLYKGKPYQYGTAWLKEKLPEDILAEIESWSK